MNFSTIAILGINRSPADNYMFKVKNTRTSSDANGVVLVSLLLTLNIFHTLF